MNKFYKRLFFLIVLVVAISGFVIYTTVDINTFRSMDRFKPWSLIMAVFAVSLGLFFDGSRLILGGRTQFLQANFKSIKDVFENILMGRMYKTFKSR